jgi:16S rRNA (guanine527-N7)-methyltransferase
MSSDGLLSRLVERASVAGIDLSPSLATRLESYYRLLAHWNASINLTALQLDPINDHALDRLLIEPLAGAQYISVSSSTAPTWFDLGSGGGSPAIPLKLARPTARLTMVESRERKAAFLREAIRTLELEESVVEGSRIETVAATHPLAGAIDLITVRAVRIDPSLFGSIRSLLMPQGRVVLFGAKRGQLSFPRDFQIVENPADQAGAGPFDVILLKRTSS